MPYRSTWWYPNYVEYGSGLNAPKTWTSVQEQYRRPHSYQDLRHYDVPCTESEDALHFRYPRLLKPKYRALFRDKPHTLPDYYPGGIDLPEGKPRGFHGRMYYEDGPPQFKYEGAKLDKLYYLEREPYLPRLPSTPVNCRDFSKNDTLRGLNRPSEVRDNNQLGLRSSASGVPCKGATPAATLTTLHTTKRMTQDGVGFL